MKEARWLHWSDAWLRLLLRFYPPDFRDDMGASLVEAYRDRCREALRRRGAVALIGIWLGALKDSMRNGPGERMRPAVSWRRRGNWGRDMEIAIRRLVRAPLFVGAVVGTLAVGLGVFAVVSTVVYRVLVSPLPYQDPNDLYFVWRDYRAFFNLDRGWLGGTDIAEMQKAGGAIEDAAGIVSLRRTLTAGDGVDPAEISVFAISTNLFRLLGTPAELGRVFADGESGPGLPPLIVLTHPLWQRLGGRAEIIGTHVRLNGASYTVIGVMPKSFGFARHASLGSPETADAYIALDVKLAETNPGSGSYAGVIRARPGTPPAQVAEAVAASARVIDARDFRSRGLKLYPVALREDLVAPVRPALRVLGAAGLLLVLVLAVNLSTLLLARTMQREREFAVSRALGANPGAIMRATLVEGTVLGGLGGAVGALAAVWGTRALVSLAPTDLPRRGFIGMDWGLAAAVVGIGALLGLVAAALPAVWGARVKLASLLSAVAVRGGGGHGRMRRVLVVVQVSLSLVMLGTAGLVVRSFGRLLRADPGFDPAGVVATRVPIPQLRFPENRDAIALQERLHAAFAAIHGVSAVSGASALPLTAGADQSTVSVPGAPGNTGDESRDRPLVDYFGVRAGYFGAMGIRMLAGRDFETAWRVVSREAVVDGAFSDHFFPAPPAALGARVIVDGDTVTIIGVVQQPRQYEVDRDGRPQMFFRAEDYGYRSLSWVIRSDRPASALGPEVRAAIRQVDPQLAMSELLPMREVRNQSLSKQRVSAVLIGTFAIGALLLAAMGLFGVVAAAVTRRRHELAVRLALGADHGRLLRLVLGEGMRLVLLGIVIGLPGAWLAGRLVRGILVGISPSDPLALSGAAIGLVLVTVAACYLPARRVLMIEPSRSMRDDSV